MSAPVLVTGSSGYVGSHLVARLLEEGRNVRATVRTEARAEQLRAALDARGIPTANLEFAFVDLDADPGWAEAVAGCEEIHHVASPIMVVQPEDPEDLIRPAREGALRVLRAARDAGARRVVLTSSYAAIGYTPKTSGEYDEEDWTDPDTPGMPAYPRSKVIAERAAWDFIAAEGQGLELVSVAPTFILGPGLTGQIGTSLWFVKSLFDGTFPAVPKQRFGVADVRDVADLHLRAMRVPEAAGRRYLCLADGPTITYLAVAEMLRAEFGALADKVPTTEAPGEDPPALVIHNERAKRELGFAPRPWQATVLETGQYLESIGLLGSPSA